MPVGGQFKLLWRIVHIECENFFLSYDSTWNRLLVVSHFYDVTFGCGGARL